MPVVNSTTKRLSSLQVNDAGQLLVTGAGGGSGGDASAAKQDAQTALLTTLTTQTDGVEASLTSIDTKTPALVSGSVPVTATTLPPGAATETTLSALNAKISAKGATTAANSTPVVLATDATVMTQNTVGTATGTITTQNLVPAGTATAGSAVEIPVVDGSVIAFQVTGTYTGALSVQSTIDGSTWVTLSASAILNMSTATYAATVTSAQVGVFSVALNGALRVRVTALAAVTGTATVSLRSSSGAESRGLVAPLPAGTSLLGAVNLSQINGTAVVTSGVSGILAVGGNIAHSAARTANPLTVGGQVATALQTTLVDGDVSYLFQTDAGQLIQKPYGSAGNDWQYAAAASGITNSTTTVQVTAAGATNIRNYMTSLDVMWETLATASELVVLDGSTVIYRTKLPTAAGQRTISFPTPLRGTAVTAMSVQMLTASATGAVYINAQGYKSF